MVAALEAEGITVRDGAAGDARRPRGQVDRRDHAAQHGLLDGRRGVPAARGAAQARASARASSSPNVTQFLFDLGSEHVDNINAVSGERCSPHPHVFSDRIIRPGDQAFFDIIHTFVGYKTCYYRTFVVGTRQRRPARRLQAGARVDRRLDRAHAARASAPTRWPSVWPKAEEFGFASEMECFGLQFGHSVGLFLHERPIISRLNSLEHPVELKEGMVIALETYCPAKDGYSAARIEEEVVITADGPQVITPLPVRRSCSSPTPTEARRMIDAAVAAPDLETALGIYRTMVECRALRDARPGAVLRGPRARHDPSRRRPGGGRGRLRARRCARDDYTFCTYRGHNHTLARGVPMAPILRRAVRARRPGCWAARAARCT